MGRNISEQYQPGEVSQRERLTHNRERRDVK